MPEADVGLTKTESTPDPTDGTPEVVNPPPPTPTPASGRDPAFARVKITDGVDTRLAKDWTEKRTLNMIGSRPISMPQAAALDRSAMMPVEAVPPVVLDAIDTLDLPPERWNVIKMTAARELGRYLNMGITVQLLKIRGFESLDQIEFALSVSTQIATSKDPSVTDATRLLAVKMIAEVAKAHTDKTRQLVELADKTSEKTSTERPRNLPPAMVQVNVGTQNQPPSVNATSGSIDVAED